MTAPRLILLVLLIVAPGCMTHLEVKTYVFDGPLQTGGLDLAEARQRLAGVLDGVAERAAEGFRQRVAPVHADFEPLFSEDAQSDVAFGEFVEQELRTATAPARKAASRDLVSLQEALDQQSRGRAQMAWERLTRSLDQLESSVQGSLETLVTEAAVEDAEAIQELFDARTRDILRSLLEGMDQGESRSSLGRRVADAEQRWLVAGDLPADPGAVIDMAAKLLGCLWSHAFDVTLPAVARSDDAGAALGTLWTHADLAQRSGRRFDPEHLAEALDHLSRLAERVQESMEPVVKDVGEAIVEQVEEQQRALLATLDLGDPMVAEVVGADRRSWKGYVNIVDVWTVVGNSEIAIKMENLGEYHLKGVVVDNDSAAEATFDILELSVKTLAAAYGAPVPVADSSGDQEGEQPVAEAPAFSQPKLQAEVAALEAKSKARAERLDQAFLQLLAFVGDLPETAGEEISAEDRADLIERRDTLASTLGKKAAELKEGR